MISKEQNKAGNVIPFDNPIVFGAQTYSDQSYYIDDLFSGFWGPGNQFGEVTWFYIVGIEIEQQYY